MVCTHTDGHNGNGNIHVHIVINSLRKYDVGQQDFMERPCDSRAGNKHHLTKKHLAYLKQSLMDLCLREYLNQVDLLTPAERKISKREYWAERRGQKKLDEQNKQMLEDGVNPRATTFQTQKEYLRLVTDLQECAKSKESAAYTQKVKLSNLHLLRQTFTLNRYVFYVIIILSNNFSLMNEKERESQKYMNSLISTTKMPFSNGMMKKPPPISKNMEFGLKRLPGYLPMKIN